MDTNEELISVIQKSKDITQEDKDKIIKAIKKRSKEETLKLILDAIGISVKAATLLFPNKDQ